MKADISESDKREFARAELDRLMISDEAMEALCLRGAGEFLPMHVEAAPMIAARLAGYIGSRKPASLMRVGNGEGTALGLTGAGVHPVQLSNFSRDFFFQNGLPIGESEALDFCAMLREALASADVIGFRACDRSVLTSETNSISDRLQVGEIEDGLGMLYARAFLHDQLSRGEMRGKILTSAWIHLSLIGHLDEIMSAASEVIVITGRTELKPAFARRLGTRLRAFLDVPVEGHRPTSREDSHYHAVFPRVLDALAGDLRGTLVLVGAGMFGKIYCRAAKASGGIAVDLGSGFDLLAGKATRPVHFRFNVEGMRWV